jgi:hypothetical protein
VLQVSIAQILFLQPRQGESSLPLDFLRRDFSTREQARRSVFISRLRTEPVSFSAQIWCESQHRLIRVCVCSLLRYRFHCCAYTFPAGYHASALRLGPRSRSLFPFLVCELAALSCVVASVPAVQTRGSTSQRVQLVISSFDLREDFCVVRDIGIVLESLDPKTRGFMVRIALS